MSEEMQEVERLRATNERLNRELDDVWDALAIQREDNASFGDAFKRQAAEIERLRAALEEIEQVALSYVHMKYAKLARAALAEEKKDAR